MIDSKYATDKMGFEICELLGIKNCRELNINFKVGNLALITVEFFVEDERLSSESDPALSRTDRDMRPGNLP